MSSGLPLRTDIARRSRHVANVPGADSVRIDYRPAVRPWEASLEMITRVAMRYSANSVPRGTAGRVPSRRSVASLGKFRRQLSPRWLHRARRGDPTARPSYDWPILARSMIERTSMLPRRASGILEATSTASSWSLASIRTKPSSCSLVSAKGPSVTRTCPHPHGGRRPNGLEGMSKDEVTARSEHVVVGQGVLREGVHLGSGHGVGVLHHGQAVFSAVDKTQAPHHTLQR